ncbi:MAG: ATP-dependent helicase, partial [Acidilobaceae archaeon]
GSASSVDEILSIASRSGLYSDLSRETVEEIVSFLEERRILRVNEKRGIGLGSRAFKYLYEVSMIPDEVDYEVYDIVSGIKIGSLSERFITDKTSSPSPRDSGNRFRFVLSGRMWECLEIDTEAKRVLAKPVAEVEGYLPSWEGELIPVDFKVAREVCSILALAMESPERAKSLPAMRKLGERADDVVKVATETAKMWGAVLSFKNPVIEALERTSILYSCLGSKGNFGLALLISEIASKWIGLEFKHIPYAIVFSGLSLHTYSIIARALLEAKRLNRADRLALIQSSLRRSRAFIIRFYHVAKRMGVLDPDARVSVALLEKIARENAGSVAEREAIREVLVDKVDLEAVNEFLDDLEAPVVVKPPKPSPLAEQVMSNPYIRSDVAVSIKTIAMDKLIEAKKRHLKSKKVVMLCISCLYWEELHVASIERSYRCPRCGSLSIAPLPTTEWGASAREAFTRLTRGEKLGAEEKELAEEVKKRAELYLNYAGQDLGDYVVMALATHGVGPARAKRVMAALIERGERGFFEELLKAEEEYITTRRYWSDRRGEDKGG